MRQTTIIKHKEVKKEWFLIDATDVVLGKLSTLVASILRGKNKPTFTPHVDMGDNVVIINAQKVKLSANKEMQKKYYSHSQYPGGLKVINAHDLKKKKPIALVQKAIKGMLPHTKLGARQFGHVFIYPNEIHQHEAQKPKKIEIK